MGEGLGELVAALLDNPWYAEHIDRFDRPLKVTNEALVRLRDATHCERALRKLEYSDTPAAPGIFIRYASSSKS